MTGLRRLLRPRGSCPAGSELSRAVSEGPDPRLQAHLGRCADCAAEYDSLRGISSELAALPKPPVNQETFDLIATALLGAPKESRPRPWTASAGARPHLARWTLTFALGGISIIGGFWLARHRSGLPASSPSPTAYAPIFTRATIRAFGDARFGRVQPPPDEAVRLDEGTLELDVPGLGPTETFRVLTMDGEIRGRATQFEATATGGRLEHVRVWRGRVEIHSSRFSATVLETGDAWSRERPGPSEVDVEARQAPASRQPTRRTAAVPARAIALLDTHPAPAAHLPTQEQIRFDRAWTLLREGRAAEAATAFSEAALRARGTSIEEDAVYWRAVALARSGDGPGARRELTAFLERFPRSSHGGEAMVALGWMLLESGQPTSARTFFERAAHDPSARVKESALEGLERTAP